MRLVTRAGVAGLLFFLLMASTVSAQVQLSIHEGRITLVATNVTVRAVLMKWAEVGHTSIANLEGIPDGPLTLQLTDVSENEALDLLLLQSVRGYFATVRSMPAPSLSRYESIVVLPPATVAQPSVAPVDVPAPLHQPKGPRQTFRNDDLTSTAPGQSTPSN